MRVRPAAAARPCHHGPPHPRPPAPAAPETQHCTDSPHLHPSRLLTGSSSARPLRPLGASKAPPQRLPQRPSAQSSARAWPQRRRSQRPPAPYYSFPLLPLFIYRAPRTCAGSASSVPPLTSPPLLPSFPALPSPSEHPLLSLALGLLLPLGPLSRPNFHPPREAEGTRYNTHPRTSHPPTHRPPRTRSTRMPASPCMPPLPSPGCTRSVVSLRVSCPVRALAPVPAPRTYTNVYSLAHIL